MNCSAASVPRELRADPGSTSTDHPGGGRFVLDGDARSSKTWTFLTNHARVLVEIARNPESRLRDLAAWTGITERATQAIVNDLEDAGYIRRSKVGRRNHYSVDPTRPFRHPAEADTRVEGLLTLFASHDHEELGKGAAARSDTPAPGAR
jgi:hypothetical protein